MSVGVCDHCGHGYVLEHSTGRERCCPRCHLPLRATIPREAAARLCRPTVPPARPAVPPRNGFHAIEDALLLAECFTRWATEAVATAKQLRQEAKEAVTAATALRSELAAQRLERQEQRWQMQRALRGA